MKPFDFIFFDSGGTLYRAGVKGENSPSAIYERRTQRIHPLLQQAGYQGSIEDLKVSLEEAESICTEKLKTNLFNHSAIMKELNQRLDLSMTNEFCFVLADLYSGPRMQEWLFPNTLETIKQLDQWGIKMGVIANTEWPGYCMDRAFSAIGLLPYFKYRVYSGDIQIKKPDVHIFKFAEELASAQGKRILYVGNDIECDIIPPKKIGWSSALRLPNENEHKQSVADLQFYHLKDLLDFVKPK